LPLHSTQLASQRLSKEKQKTLLSAILDISIIRFECILTKTGRRMNLLVIERKAVLTTMCLRAYNDPLRGPFSFWPQASFAQMALFWVSLFHLKSHVRASCRKSILNPCFISIIHLRTNNISEK
jgi:hypothetical protein